MAPRKRVKCSCNCGNFVTTQTQSKHLELKFMKRNVVATAIQKRRTRIQLLNDVSVRAQSPRSPRSQSPDFSIQSPLPIPNPDDPFDIHSVFDPSELWERVLASRAILPDSNSNPTSTSGSERSLVSQSDSDADAQPEEDEQPSFSLRTGGVSLHERLHEDILVRSVMEAPQLLSSSHLDDITTFNLITRNKLSVLAYHDMQQTFCLKDSHSDLPSLKKLRTRIQNIAGLKPIDYDCCKDSCICFTGPFSALDSCPECNTPRKNSAGRPQNSFQYMPFIPQVQSLYYDPESAALMQSYRHEFNLNDGLYRDIFHGKRYQELRKMQVVVDGVPKSYKYYEDRRELALGLSTDGMCPFKKRKKSCTPVILINYNLPPEIRTHIDNIICVGVVPGPKAPKNMSSFLWPLIEELLKLAEGVPTVDIFTQTLFSLRAHLLAAFGDIPAITKLLEFIGHNGRYPCRFCLILTVQGTTAKGGTHLYCPLHRSGSLPVDPLNLPLRTHADCLKKGFHVLEAPTENARASRASECGIKGVSALARLPSVSIPGSFPVDIMHMIWINLIPQLIRLWTEDFNNIGEGVESYAIHPTLWQAIGSIAEASGATIPSSFGCRVPNVAKPGHSTAETWSIFATHLAPNILRKRFRNAKYYHHFVQLIKLVNKCTSYTMLQAELPLIRRGFAQWVQDYEKFYYQYDPHRLQVCTVNVHYLLHIADSIEFIGPVWCYWAYPMERYCSFIGAAVKSRRFPYNNIARRIRDTAWLQIVRRNYRLKDRLLPLHAANKDCEDDDSADKVPGYPRALLLTPRNVELHMTPPLRNKIVTYLTTAFGVEAWQAREVIPDLLKQWGRLRISGGGDLIYARGLSKLRADGRDSSFVRYELLVDRDAHLRNAPERLERVSQYGQLERIFALPLQPHTPINNSPHAVTLLLALISEAPVRVETTHQYQVVWYEGDLQSGEVVDVQTIQCVLGRIFDGKRRWIIDRTMGADEAFPEFT